MITFAPERPGATDAIVRVVASGAVAAIKPPEATYEQTCAAISSGATVATHLFNAMPSIHHRAPGPIVALLDDPRVMVELICDGVHLDPAVYRHVLHSVGQRRISLITDAMAAAGMPDGGYGIGGLSVDVIDRVARVAGTETIAGSTATMDPLSIFRYKQRPFGRCGVGPRRCSRRRSTPPGRWAFRHQNCGSAHRETWSCSMQLGSKRCCTTGRGFRSARGLAGCARSR